MLSTSLNRLPYFVAVVETGSFSAAARHLNVAKAVVSHQIAKLEDELGAALLIRTTRQVRPTEGGLRFYEHCSEILRRSGEAFEEIKEENTVPTGTLRLTAPFDYGMQVVVPTVRRYMEHYPDVKIELSLDDPQIDIVESSIDLSIRVGWPRDSTALMRKVASFRQIPVAAPKLLAGNPALRHPTDLVKLPIVANLALSNPLRGTFTQGGKTEAVTFEAQLSADRTAVVHASARLGLGFAILPDFLAGEDIEKGDLVDLLPDWEMPEGGIYVVFPPSRFRPAKTRKFVDMLLEVHTAQIERAAAR